MPGETPNQITLMKLTHICCITVLATIATTINANAQSWDFTVFESAGADTSDLDEISLSAHLFNTVDGVEIRIANTSVPGDDWVTNDMPTITSLFFEDGDSLLIAPSFNAAGSIGGVSYDYSPGGSLPGGDPIAFDTVFTFKAKPSPVNNGIDPNEVGSFTFTGSDYGTVLAAINNGEIRVGAHVQQINGSDSASYVVPEPGTGVLALLGVAALLRRKR
jgi:hypothetical protein